ncbi:MAG: SusC/RagA family TonB-linked outer membrane protein [Gemmatimonadales bacterium]
MTHIHSLSRTVTSTVLALGLSFAAQSAVAQTATVEGRVTAASGNPIVGAQVTVVGTNIGTLSVADGRYVLLNLPPGSHQVRITAIGYKGVVLRVAAEPGATASANAELAASVLQLDAVVVTGTAGQARRREVGNTIEQLNLTDVKDPPASVDQLLQGRVQGLTVMQGTGSAGAGSQIRLRGGVSVSQSNQPIVYIDGIRVRSEGYRRNAPAASTDFTGRSTNIQTSPLNDINPGDIERVEILKGAAASTLYGTEASAGVIQIFTKKGSRGAPKWTAQVDQGFAQLQPFGTDWNPYVNFKPADSMVVVNGQLQTALAREDGESCRQRVADDRAAGSVPPSDTLPTCNWLRNGHRQKAALSVAGGFQGFQYFISGSTEDYDGVLPQDNERRFVTRGNFGFDVSDKIRLDWNTSYTNYNVRNSPSGNNAQGITLNVYRAERNYRNSPNPFVIDSLLNQSITTEIDRLITGGSVYYTPNAWFNHRFTVGLDLAQQENRNLRPFGFVSQTGGVLFDEQNKYTTLTADYVGNVDYRMTGELSSTFSFGGQAITTEDVRTYAHGTNFPGPGEPTVSNGSTFLARENRTRLVNAGFFLQNIFKLRDRYFVTVGARFDGNSAFGQSLGLQTYPKASVSYVISEEPFWPSGWGEMKLRAALGWSGRAPGAFDKLKTWSPAVSSNQSAFLPSNKGNPDLGPERTREFEIGFDGGFLNNRLSAAFTYYHRLTTDALFSVRQISSLGFPNAQLENVGALRNHGIEAALSGSVLDRPNWGLDLGATAYTNHSLILALGGAAPFAAGGGWIEPGFPVFAAKGVKIYNADAIAAADTVCRSSCAQDSQYVYGPQQPTLVWIMSATLRLPRGITLSGRGEYQGGAWIYQGSAANALSRSVRWPTCRRAHLLLEANFPYTIADTTFNRIGLTARERKECVPARLQDDVLWEPQDFFKLRDLTLTVPVGALFRQASAATLTLSAQNWVRWFNSELRMFDPEMTNRDGLDEQSREISEHIPPAATFTASLRVTF